MREAIGNAFVLNLVIIFLTVLMLVFIGTMSYTKAFKLKNAIINYIDEKDGMITNNNDSGLKDGIINSSKDINYILSSIGYQVRVNKDNANCKGKNLSTGTTTHIIYGNNTSGYNYCIYKYINSSNDYYYGVTTFMKFEFPIINQLIEFPVYGETKVYGKIN